MNLLKNRLLWSLSVGHFAVDLVANITPMMLPFFLISMGLDYTRVGLIATMYIITSSLAQPVFGYLADRFGGRYLAPLGIVWISAWIGLVGFIPDYTAILVIMFFAGLGSAAFHPQGAMNTAIIGGERKASAMSVFMLGGNVGYSFGPIIGGVLFLTFGLRGTVVLAVVGLILAAWVFHTMPAVESHRRKVLSDSSGRKPASRVAVVGIVSLILIIMLRSWTTSGVNSFLPLLYGERGYPVEATAQVLFVMLLFLAIGGFLGGFLADRIGRRSVVFLSLLLSAPATYLFLQLPPPLSLAVAAPLGLLLGASTAVTIVMSQELLPQNVGMASGLTMGLAFVTSGIGITAIGSIADRLGLPFALNIFSVLPILAALLCWNLKPAPAKVLAQPSPKV